MSELRVAVSGWGREESAVQFNSDGYRAGHCSHQLSKRRVILKPFIRLAE